MTAENHLRKKSQRWVWMILLSLLFISSPLVGMAASSATLGRYIVILSEDVDEAQVEGVASELSRKHGAVSEHVYTKALKGFSAKIPKNRLSDLKSDFRVNNIVDDLPVQAFCHSSTTQTLPTGVNRIDADKSSTANITNSGPDLNVDIAILDTGIYKHRDLNVSDSRAFDCTKSGCPPVKASDKNGHGTHVAGIAAARDNTNSVVGVAPGARLWQVKVLGSSGSGFTSWVIAGINKVTANASAIEVANMSLGGAGSNTPNCGKNGTTVVDPLHNAICNSVAKGVVYTVAAGNESQDAANATPAAYDEVITVSALADSDGQPGGLGAPTSYGPDDSFATFSNFGAAIDLIAPGVVIFSTWPGDSAAPQGYCADSSGTSMAAPHVAGAVALYLATHPKPTSASGVAAVRDALRSASLCPNGSVFGLGPCSSGWSGNPDGITEPLVNVGGF